MKQFLTNIIFAILLISSINLSAAEKNLDQRTKKVALTAGSFALGSSGITATGAGITILALTATRRLKRTAGLSYPIGIILLTIGISLCAATIPIAIKAYKAHKENKLQS